MKALRFERPATEFELLETENGSPSGKYAESKGSKSKKTTKTHVYSRLADNVTYINDKFCADINKDLIVRRFKMLGGREGMIVFLSGMARADTINDFVLRPVFRCGRDLPEGGEAAKFLIEKVIDVSEIEAEEGLEKIAYYISEGKTALFLDGMDSAVIADTRGYEKRGVSESENERTVFGPKEAFNENLRTNITLLRRIIKASDFICEFRETKTKNKARAAIAYCAEVANVTVVNEVKRRIAAIETNYALDLGTLEQLMEPNRLMLLPRTLMTERPDKAASHILSGHIAVLLDGSPFAMVLPVTLFSLMSSGEDTYMTAPLGTVLRLVRYIGMLISILLPGYFLAAALYHQGVLSSEVLMTIISSRRLVYVSLGSEMIFLLFIFHLIREAGMRVPGSIGQAIGIIGGLILGQAAVTANIVSSVVLILVALTGLGNFCIPNYRLSLTASYIRIGAVIAGWMAGFLGIAAFIVVLVAYIASQKSCGVPYLTPFAPKTHSKRPFVIRGFIKMSNRHEDYTNTMEDKKL